MYSNDHFTVAFGDSTPGGKSLAYEILLTTTVLGYTRKSMVLALASREYTYYIHIKRSQSILNYGAPFMRVYLLVCETEEIRKQSMASTFLS